MPILRSVAVRIQALFTWWVGDIRRRRSLVGKVASLTIGLFVLCCACSFGLAVVRSTGQAVGLVPPNTPTAVPQALALAPPANEEEAPTAQATAEAPPSTPTAVPPTNTVAPSPSATPTAATTPTTAPTEPPPTATSAPVPTATVAPTSAPVAVAPTSEPTALPAPEPTATPAPPPPEPTQAPAAAPGEPRYTGEGQDKSVDPPYWPCQPGQIKGNVNSGKYHVPDGRYYAKTGSLGLPVREPIFSGRPHARG